MNKPTQTSAPTPARPRRRIAGEPLPGPNRPHLTTTKRGPVRAAPTPRARVTAPRERVIAPGSASTRGSRATRAMIVLVVLIGLGFVTAAGWRWLSAPDMTSVRAEATRAAISATETIFTFASDDLDQHTAASTAVMTDSFAEEFADIAPALAGIAPDREFQVTSSVAEAAPVPCGSECSDSQVTVLVFFDQARLVAGLDDPAVLDNRAEVTLVKVDGSWLVDDIRAL